MKRDESRFQKIGGAGKGIGRSLGKPLGRSCVPTPSYYEKSSSNRLYYPFYWAFLIIVITELYHSIHFHEGSNLIIY